MNRYPIKFATVNFLTFLADNISSIPLALAFVAEALSALPPPPIYHPVLPLLPAATLMSTSFPGPLYPA